MKYRATILAGAVLLTKHYISKVKNRKGCFQYEAKNFDSTPLKQQGAKRPTLEMSPLCENEHAENIQRTIAEAVKKAIKSAVAQIVTSFEAENQEFIQTKVNSAMTSLRDDVMKSLQSANDFVLNKS